MPVYTYTTLDDPFGSSTIASGINAAGQIVGSYIDASGLNGFLYSGGTYTAFDDPSATDGTEAVGINGNGQVVGRYFINNIGNAHGFLLTGVTYTTLDDPLATKGTRAAGINAAGQIVGWYDDASGTHGFLYSNGLYATLDEPFASGNLTIAEGINDSGQIVGFYDDSSGKRHGFLFNPNPIFGPHYLTPTILWPPVTPVQAASTPRARS